MGAAALALLVTPAFAGKESADLSIRFVNKPPQVGFIGKVKVDGDALATCGVFRSVTVFRVAPGHDRAVGGSHADRGGQWFSSTYKPSDPGDSVPTGRFYAKIEKIRVGQTTCGAARSRTVTVNGN